MSVKSKVIGLILVVLVIAIALFFLKSYYRPGDMEGRQAGNQEPQDTESSQEMPPDLQAFYGTYAVREPEKRLEALNKFLVDYPDSQQTWNARREIFKLTIELWPDDRDRMIAAALPAEEIQDRIDRSSGYRFLAAELLKANVFLDDAESFALKSIQTFDKDLFIDGQKAGYEENSQDIPSDPVLEEKYLKELAVCRTTLGRIYLEKGRIPEGEKILNEACAVDPLIAQAAIGLAQIAESRGRNDDALDYLTTAALTAGYEMEDARKRMEKLYRRTHDGSLDGLETTLDNRYKQLFPNPINVERYLPDESRSSRVVLVESFTGAG